MAETNEASIVRIQPQPLARPTEFTAEQRQMVKDSIANGMNDSEFSVFMEVARARSLNPLTRQITPISRWDEKKNRNVWSYQVTIDGLRCIAERTGRYEGQTPMQWCAKDGKWTDVWLKTEAPAAARVGVYKQGFREALYAVARWDSYAVTGKGGFMWSKMPDLMLGKCAEALALRKAFPEDMSGLYTDDEMGQADNGKPDKTKEKPTLAAKLDEKVRQAAEILDGQVVEVIEKAKAQGDYLMPFASRKGIWQRGDPIASVETVPLRDLLPWAESNNRAELVAAIKAELAKRPAEPSSDEDGPDA